ncbi:hypothetical protein E5Q_04010 [Mixia osmundae IAM 14324]|uniref:lactoylglutathione lyase n=1 Tax=Mixia osmundae (strain CBS 9802 / IAM 14324 / JCM 22182 / KY 12970) TaxID=764103 RepID=G7E3C2_MIXOS|nr:hypothetical protein E5Q_04010 [Mixia osmundae IAM 14324]
MQAHSLRSLCRTAQAAERISFLNRQISPSPISHRGFSRSSVKMAAPPETKGTKLNHTMLRVKDPKKSLDFYQNTIGMSLIDTHEADSFTLYFLAFDSAETAGLKRNQREGILELTHNHGSESDDKVKYHNGNDEPQGFGHICISVPNLQEACDRFEKLGVEFKKKPSEGKMRNIAFLYDPDHYWIEVIAH